MVEIGNRISEKDFVKYLRSLGIEVHLNTKARGHSGFCTGKRIDVSKNLPEDKIMEVLLHEFAHYVHFKLEPEIVRTHGSLEKLFCTNDAKALEYELFQITLLAFDNTQIRRLEKIKDSVNQKLKLEREKIKEEYPNFQAAKKFKEFDKYVRHSNARYLLKYDRVLIKGGWFASDTLISVNSLKTDFPTMPDAFVSYIKSKSLERHRNRLNARISKYNRYLKQPTELFARFFQMYCTDYDAVKNLAPKTFSRFEQLLFENYYPFLKECPLFSSQTFPNESNC